MTTRAFAKSPTFSAVSRLAEAFLFREGHAVTGGKVVFRMRCRDCEKTWEFNQGNHGVPPPDMVLKRARRDGWLVNYGKKPRCPLHAVEPAHYRSITLTIPPPAPVTRPLSSTSGVAIMSAAPSANGAQPNMKIARQVMALLETGFDETTRRFVNGWSDERIAQETGASLVAVAKIRCEAFGELADDPQIASLRDALAEHELQAEEYLKNAKALSAKLESFIAARKIGG